MTLIEFSIDDLLFGALGAELVGKAIFIALDTVGIILIIFIDKEDDGSSGTLSLCNT